MRKSVSNEQIITALLSSSTVRQAARDLNIQEKTLYKRMTDSVFKTEYRQARADLIKTASAKLQNKLSVAIDVLCSIMTDESLPPMIRLRAAESVVRTSLSLYESADLTERIDCQTVGQINQQYTFCRSGDPVKGPAMFA